MRNGLSNVYNKCYRHTLEFYEGNDNILSKDKTLRFYHLNLTDDKTRKILELTNSKTATVLLR